ncbi:MAG: glycoside hydrolase family 3 C-terminal domain-containing protein [Comamonadaceae bacterium]|nr:glycoside hydrolase family 3 C-terminal domain-containing protein [Comamonadaceae bacterium]
MRKTERIAVLGALAETVRLPGRRILARQCPQGRFDPRDASQGRDDRAMRPGYRLIGDGYDQKLLDVAKEARSRQGQGRASSSASPTPTSRKATTAPTSSLPFGHEELIRQVAELTTEVVVVLEIGSPVAMPWIKSVKGVVNAYLLGEAGAGAVADVLYGITNPSGRLPESFPLQAADVPVVHAATPRGNAKAYYQESIYVGYRYYQTKNMPVLFPFGYGLSYTSFTVCEPEGVRREDQGPGTLKIAVDVTNAGAVGGREVVQLYVENARGPVFKAACAS